MDTTEEDLQRILDQQGKALPLKTAFSLGTCVSGGLEYVGKQDLRKAHDGTIEFASREARTGAHTRRGAVELLGYNLLQWLCCRLLREDNLKSPKYVSQQKSSLIENFSLLMSKCFPHGNIPCGIRVPAVRDIRAI
ncbi:hypothetical protein MTO96_005816 [Rhipicephalus appendiculatus]